MANPICHLEWVLYSTNPQLLLQCFHFLRLVLGLLTIKLDRTIILRMMTAMMGRQLDFAFLIPHMVGNMSSTMIPLTYRKTGVDRICHQWAMIAISCPVVTAVTVIIGYLVMVSKILMVGTQGPITTTELIIIE